MDVRTGQHHGFSDEEAFDPRNQYAFKVDPIPKIDHAAAALQAAQDAYFKQWPDARKNASALIWRIRIDRTGA